MAEADENDDQEINYNEFMPVAIDLIQSFKARRFAKRTAEADEKEVTEATLEKLYGPEIERSCELAEKLFFEADGRNTGTLSRPEFRRRLKESALNLTRSEQNMVMATMPVDAFSKIVYGKFKDVLYKVKYNSIKNAIIENKATDTAKLLLDLCREQEQIKMDLDAASGGHPASVEDGEEPAYTGSITAKQLATVLGSPRLGLSKLQITSVLSDAVMVDSMVDYWKFVPVASTTIERMLDPSVMETKIEILSKGLLSEEKCMNGKSEVELAKELNGLFDMYDLDESGQLDEQEFTMCLNSLDLDITKQQIDALMVVADADKSGLVDRKEFMNFTFNHLLHMMKERHLARLHEDIDRAAKGEAIDGDDRDLLSKEDESIDAHAFDALLSPDLDGEGKDERVNLMEMFRRADAGNNGYLSANEFHRLLEAMDLGLTQYQMARLMAEADENEDGCISYAEFVPVMLKFLQTYKTKQKASVEWSQRVADAEKRAQDAQHVMRHQLDESIHIVEHAFREASRLETSGGDAGVVEIGSNRTSQCSFPRLSRASFLRCLGIPRANLSRQMVNMVAAKIRASDLDGLTPTSNFKDVVLKCHLENCKRQILESIPTSSLELHLRQILSERERHFRRDLGQFEEESYAGALPAKEVYRALFAAKHLHLTRQQLLAVMSLQEECLATAQQVEERESPRKPGSPGSALGDSRPNSPHGKHHVDVSLLGPLIDLMRFCAEASVMIADFFDVVKLKRRASLALSIKSQSVALLRGSRADDLEEMLTTAFRRFDVSDTGTISMEEFQKVIQSITVLDLSRGEISAVLSNAPTDEDGLILWEDFLLDSSEIFNMLAQERQMKHLSELHDKQFDVNGDVQPLERAQVERLCADLINCSQLDIDANDPERLSLAFIAFSDAAAGDAGTPGKPSTPKPSITAQMSGKKDLKHVEMDEDPWKRDQPMYKDGRRVPVVDASDRPLDVNLQPLEGDGLRRKKQEPLERLVLIEITRADKTIAIVAIDSESGARYETWMKLPSLAIVDPEAGLGFVQRVASKVRIQRNADGGEQLRIR